MNTYDMILGRGRNLEFLHDVTQSWDDWSASSFVAHLAENTDSEVYFYTSRQAFWNGKRSKKFSAKDAIQFLRASGRA